MSDFRLVEAFCKKRWGFASCRNFLACEVNYLTNRPFCWSRAVLESYFDFFKSRQFFEVAICASRYIFGIFELDTFNLTPKN